MFLNPRSPLYQIAKRVQAAPFVVFSIGIHLIMVAILMNITVEGGANRSDDLIIETTILDKDEVFLDPKELLEKISELAESDIPKEEMRDNEKLEAPEMELPPDEAEEVEDAMTDDDLEADQLDEALDAINSITLGEGETMVVSVGDWDSHGRQPTGFRGRLSKGYRKQAREKYHGSEQAENAVLAGLSFLAKYQQPDGHWSSSPEAFHRGMKGTNDTAITGLALLCFLGAGHTEAAGKYQPVVSKAVNYLRRVQGDDGSWQVGGRMYGHGICAMSMSEAYGMAKGRSAAREAAQKGITYIVEKQGEEGGFGYTGPGNDTSVTGWQVMACKSARVAELEVPEETFKKFEKHFDEMLDPETGKTGYSKKGEGSMAMSAVGLVCRLFLGQEPEKTPVLDVITSLIDDRGPELKNVYYLYYGTLGQFQVGGDVWKNWNDQFAIPVVSMQLKSGVLAGSWDTQGISHLDAGGPVYVTSMYILCLEVYYRYLPLYHKKDS